MYLCGAALRGPLARTIRWKRLAGRSGWDQPEDQPYVHGEERTTGRRRREEIKGGPSKDRSDPGAYRRGECEKSRNRAGGPPAGSPARYQRGLSFTLSALSSLVQLCTRVIIIESAGCIDAVDRNTLACVPIQSCDISVRYSGVRGYEHVRVQRNCLVAEGIHSRVPNQPRFLSLSLTLLFSL